MTAAKFLQIHYLTAFPATLLNRDDIGFAKRIPFGGVSRIRVSSQCLKQHWRTAEGLVSLKNLGVEMSVRSQGIFEKMIAQPLIAKFPEKEKNVRAVVACFRNKLLGESKSNKEKAERKNQKEKSDIAAHLETKQLIVLGPREIAYISALVEQVLSREGDVPEATRNAEELLKSPDLRANLQSLRYAAGLDAALFGRMVTGDILARGDAAVHVAHAFTVHAEESERDYFTAVDDLVVAAQELGSAHLGDTELTTGVYYGYVVVDIPLLISNLSGDRTLTAKVLSTLLHLIATVSPGAKKGSTAPYSYAHFLLAEAGARQPRTLANAFLVPVRKGGNGLLSGAIAALGSQLSNFDRMYGKEEERRVVAMSDTAGVPAEPMQSLQELAAWVAGKVNSHD